MTGLRDLFSDGILMNRRELETETGHIAVERETEEPEWLRCSEEQWEKKSELAAANGDMGEALKYADYANCRAMYDSGLTVKQIQGRFNHE